MMRNYLSGLVLSGLFVSSIAYGGVGNDSLKEKISEISKIALDRSVTIQEITPVGGDIYVVKANGKFGDFYYYADVKNKHIIIGEVKKVDLSSKTSEVLGRNIYPNTKNLLEISVQLIVKNLTDKIKGALSNPANASNKQSATSPSFPSISLNTPSKRNFVNNLSAVMAKKDAVKGNIKDTESISSVELGQGPRHYYLVLDVSCPYSRDLVRNLSSKWKVLEKKVKLTIIPVHALGYSDGNLRVLKAKSMDDVMRAFKNDRVFNAGASADVEKNELKNNMKFVRENNVEYTPTLIWEGGDKKVHKLSDYKDILKELGI